MIKARQKNIISDLQESNSFLRLKIAELSHKVEGLKSDLSYMNILIDSLINEKKH